MQLWAHLVMSGNGVRLYAEFLLNISQVTIFVALDLTGKQDKTAHFFSDRKRIEITYAGDKAAITFPKIAIRMFDNGKLTTWPITVSFGFLA